MLKKEKIPFPSSGGLEIMRGKVSEEKEIVLGEGEKKFVRLVEQGGGLLGVPDKKEWAGILNHSLIVRRVATYLARELKAAGENVNLEVVGEGALLHDIGRRQEDERIWYKKEPGAAGSHAQEGVKILKGAGFSKEISDIAETHSFPQKEELDSWEKKLVFYADTRVAQSIISLSDRFKDAEKRWVLNGKVTREKMDKRKKIAQDIEQEIFSKLEVKPDGILNLPMSRVERYLRTIIERNLEDRAIKFFRDLEERKAQKKSENETAT